MWLSVWLLAAAAAASPPAPTRWVTDEAAALAPAERQTLDAELQAFEQKTGHQLVVYVGRTTGGEPIEDWAVRTFAAWRVGRAGLDDGVAFFVMLDDRAARIEVGYGLEAELTDVQSSRILREVLIPRMRAGDVTGGVVAATRAIESTLSTGSSTPAERSVGEKVKLYGIGIAIALFVVFAIFNPRAALALLWFFSGRGGRGFGGRGGGGFSGGGGRSGGGGATGRW